MARRVTDFAGYQMIDDRVRTTLLPDRSQAGLLVTVGRRPALATTMTELTKFVPSGTVMVLNTSGTFKARVDNVRLRSERLGAVYFSQMLEATHESWVIAAPEGCQVGDTLQLPGRATLRLERPYRLANGQRAVLRRRRPQYSGDFWCARFESAYGFERWQITSASPVVYAVDGREFGYGDLQNCFSLSPTSARMNNGGRNLTTDILRQLRQRGVQIARVEVRTSIGADQYGQPFSELVELDARNAAIINDGIRRGSLVLPVGTGVIRALDWLYDPQRHQVRPGTEWCKNIITPDTGTWLNGWVSGMHEPRSSHLAMGAAVMGEDVIRAAMLSALEHGMWFHENGDTHLHLPG